uniref:LIM zinc-binding domain-containing protein n=1 Tax=Sinocyclocheilus grahami TaxID=75366 RepID=A0A672KAP6_SINGR
FPVNMGGSDVCYFCGRRVYVMERLSAEGKFFHRSCFQCDYCSSTLQKGKGTERYSGNLIIHQYHYYTSFRSSMCLFLDIYKI